jgi:hypothetical protein
MPDRIPKPLFINLVTFDHFSEFIFNARPLFPRPPKRPAFPPRGPTPRITGRSLSQARPGTRPPIKQAPPRAARSAERPQRRQTSGRPKGLAPPPTPLLFFVRPSALQPANRRGSDCGRAPCFRRRLRSASKSPPLSKRHFVRPPATRPRSIQTGPARAAGARSEGSCASLHPYPEGEHAEGLSPPRSAPLVQGA